MSRDEVLKELLKTKVKIQEIEQNIVDMKKTMREAGAKKKSCEQIKGLKMKQLFTKLDELESKYLIE